MFSLSGGRPRWLWRSWDDLPLFFRTLAAFVVVMVIAYVFGIALGQLWTDIN
jgi:hypothetical protein